MAADRNRADASPEGSGSDIHVTNSAITEFTLALPLRHPFVTPPDECVPVQSRERRAMRVVTLVAGFVAVGLLARAVLQADTSWTWRAISSAGPLVVVALAPFAVGMTLDACGTVVLLRALGVEATVARVLPVRLATEALHLSIPGGFVAADTGTALLLESGLQVPLRIGVVASIARKWLVMRSHAVYIAFGAVIGSTALDVVSQRLLDHPGLRWVVLASAAVPLCGSGAIGAALLGRSTFANLHATLSRLRWPVLARWLDGHRETAAATDAHVARIRAAHVATLVAGLSFLACWCVEALESALLLHLVGADVGLRSVFAVEAGNSLVRACAVMAPSGLGVVDLGYATVLPLLGADAGSASAFVLLKRAKEVIWVVVGYAILIRLRPPTLIALSPAARARNARQGRGSSPPFSADPARLAAAPPAR